MFISSIKSGTQEVPLHAAAHDYAVWHSCNADVVPTDDCCAFDCLSLSNGLLDCVVHRHDFVNALGENGSQFLRYSGDDPLPGCTVKPRFHSLQSKRDECGIADTYRILGVLLAA